MDSVGKKETHKFFTTGDGTFLEQLNIIYNKSKNELALNEIPIWFTNGGIYCSEAKILFFEFEDYMVKISNVVKGLYNKEFTIEALKAD
jgi:hypothetical protein